ncbi:hypothetical protein B0J11DRAFT_582337 [Dendryphion nanum]|uniref:Uncharacterized protein n=1 Tax=Dendryphion nanum TaxID=256645 RepID=A0A9P9DJ26_9PLEO|nr:hypothetical protein B0J11DRAFT_582337 [Dendryphion nanum]
MPPKKATSAPESPLGFVMLRSGIKVHKYTAPPKDKWISPINLSKTKKMLNSFLARGSKKQGIKAEVDRDSLAAAINSMNIGGDKGEGKITPEEVKARMTKARIRGDGTSKSDNIPFLDTKNQTSRKILGPETTYPSARPTRAASAAARAKTEAEISNSDSDIESRRGLQPNIPPSFQDPKSESDPPKPVPTPNQIAIVQDLLADLHLKYEWTRTEKLWQTTREKVLVIEKEIEKWEERKKPTRIFRLMIGVIRNYHIFEEELREFNKEADRYGLTLNLASAVDSEEDSEEDSDH